MAKATLVSVVISTHNRKQKLCRLLDSIIKSKYPKEKLEVIVVDDASTDGTFEEVKNTFQGVMLIRNEKEQLLARSRNIGILRAHGDFIFVIDDDNLIAEDTISELVKAMNRINDLGIAGPLMYYLADPSRVWCGRVKRHRITSLTTFPERGKYNVKSSGILESDEFPNAFMIRREVIEKVGLFDEVVFPIHNDEGDLCNRVRMAGFKIGLVPTARVWHDTPLPSEEHTGARRFHVHDSQRAFYSARSRILFCRKYCKIYEFFAFISVFMPLVFAVYLKVILTDLSFPLRERVNIIKCYLKGIVEGITLKWNLNEV
jgi:hypothetical protein